MLGCGCAVVDYGGGGGSVGLEGNDLGLLLADHSQEAIYLALLLILELLVQFTQAWRSLVMWAAGPR